jgi:RNA-directed DNA polymerase
LGCWVNRWPGSRAGGGINGVPIGNLTSQLFANIYLNEFDHFIKDKLQIKYYLRYTDDFIILGQDPAGLAALLPVIRKFLRDELVLELHPRKIILRKFRQGIDFLGYVVLPHYRALRTKTKRRMFRQISVYDKKYNVRLQSYLGLLSHCRGHALRGHLMKSDSML